MTELYVGLDVSLEQTAICIVDGNGHRVFEGQATSDPEAIAMELRAHGDSFARVGFEAGPLSQWLYFGLEAAGFPAVCIEARHAKAAMTAMNRNKNDRNDARSIAQFIRSGWFKRVHVKSVARSYARYWLRESSSSTSLETTRTRSVVCCVPSA